MYSTRCPPLPRLRLTESREVVRRAALRAKGVDPDLVERCVTPTAKNKHERTAPADSAGDSPMGTTKPSPRAADPLADLVDGADALFDLPEGRKRDRGGGGGGDFSVGARADHHLRTMHDVRRVRAERRALRTLLPPGKRRGIRAGEGRDDATTNVPSSSSSNPGVEGTYSSKSTVWNRGADRVVAEERKRVEGELNALRTLVRRRECAHNAAVNARVGRERELRALNGELEVVTREAARTNDLSGLAEQLAAARAKAREKQALADEEAETSLRRAHIARRLTAHNVELRRANAALKADLADATADADACREYERGALDARKRAHDALEWVRARYLERVNAWKRDVAHAKTDHDELLDALKEEKTKERILARRLERERARSEADCDGAKRATESAREEVERRESEEESCRVALREAGVRRGFARRRDSRAGADPRAAGEVEGREGGSGGANRRGAGTGTRRVGDPPRQDGGTQGGSTGHRRRRKGRRWKGDYDYDAKASDVPAECPVDPTAAVKRRPSVRAEDVRRRRPDEAVEHEAAGAEDVADAGGFNLRGSRVFAVAQTPKSCDEDLRPEAAPPLRPRLGGVRGIEEGRATGALDRVAEEGTEREDSRFQPHHVLARHHGRGPKGGGRHGHQGHQGAQARGAPGRRRRPRERRVTGRRRQGRR